MQISQEGSAADLSAFLERGRGHVHFVGVCGIGMAGLASLLKDAGFGVSGCDLAPGKLAVWLEERGIPVSDGHDPAHVTQGVDLVVRSAAVPVEAPEIERARGEGVPVFSRGEVLSHIAWPGLVAVGGTHGKTTTTTFIAQLLKGAGRDPSWCVGGEVSGCGCVGVSGSGSGGITVVEADESDGTLALYRPDIAVVTNIEFDHMEHFGDADAFRECFRTFMDNAGVVVYCGDDAEACRVSRVACWEKSAGRLVSYGFSDGCDVRAVDLIEKGMAQEFTLATGDGDRGRVELGVPGRHNVLNALGAAATALQLGLSLDEIVEGLANVRLPGRRFEIVALSGGVSVVSDYAHHPSEVAALVDTAGRLEHRRILAVFQPHRYTRTLALGPDFPGGFRGADEVVLLPVYAASEAPLNGGRVWDLYAHFRAGGGFPGTVAMADSLEQVWAYIRKKAGPGDIVLVVGAGDVERIGSFAGREIGNLGKICGKLGREDVLEFAEGVEGLDIRLDEPLGAKTTFGVGGEADIWAEVTSRSGLARLLAWCADLGIPFRLLGAGSNVLVSDLGVRGVAARLAGGEFRSIEIETGSDGQVAARAGGALPVAALLDRLERESLSGLEFLEGIPASVGGALRMNAGAMGDEIGPHVSWIRCLNMDGSERIVNRDELRFSYRCCDSLRDCIAVEAGLRVRAGRSEEIASRRREFRDRRKWMSGLRCAGSVFRNPPEDRAGRLIDEAGLKETGVGGAAVSPLHANVIVAEPGACASDVLALLERVRTVVFEKSGVLLENEIIVLG